MDAGAQCIARAGVGPWAGVPVAGELVRSWGLLWAVYWPLVTDAGRVTRSWGEGEELSGRWGPVPCQAKCSARRELRLPPTTPSRGSYRTEEDVVEAGGHGVHLTPGGAAPLVLQPAPACDSKPQQQQRKEEEGAGGHRRHQRGHCPVPCGPQGA